MARPGRQARRHRYHTTPPNLNDRTSAAGRDHGGVGPAQQGDKLTTAVTTTQTTTWHHEPNAEPDRDADQAAKREVAYSWGHRVAVIIVSESSAKVTLRVRTERCAPVRSRGSAALNDTLRYADARPISVHTGVLARISVPSDISGSPSLG